MVDLTQLKSGMQVKIVDSWNRYCNQNSEGEMDYLLGTIVTVGKIYKFHDIFDIKEDRRWVFNKHCVDRIIEDKMIERISSELINDFLFTELEV